MSPPQAPAGFVWTLILGCGEWGLTLPLLVTSTTAYWHKMVLFRLSCTTDKSHENMKKIDTPLLSHDRKIVRLLFRTCSVIHMCYCCSFWNIIINQKYTNNEKKVLFNCGYVCYLGHILQVCSLALGQSYETPHMIWQIQSHATTRNKHYHIKTQNNHIVYTFCVMYCILDHVITI